MIETYTIQDFDSESEGQLKRKGFSIERPNLSNLTEEIVKSPDVNHIILIKLNDSKKLLIKVNELNEIDIAIVSKKEPKIITRDILKENFEYLDIDLLELKTSFFCNSTYISIYEYPTNAKITSKNLKVCNPSILDKIIPSFSETYNNRLKNIKKYEY